MIRRNYLPLVCMLALGVAACGSDDPASSDPDPKLTIIPNTNTVLIGQTIQFQAERFGEPATVTWSDSSPAIAQVGTSTSGVVRGIEAGQAVLKATLFSDDSVQATATVTVEAQQIDSIEVFPSELTLTLNERFTLGTIISGAPGVDTDVTWETGSNNIASVNTNGEVRGTGVGRTLITAIADGDPGKKAFCLVEVVSGN